MSNTANLGMPKMPGGVAEGYITHNESLSEIDALLQGAVANRTSTSPPGTVEGSCYIPAATATGAWTGLENKIVYYNGSGWKSYTPKTGWRIWCTAEKATLYYNGSGWKALDEAVFGAYKSDGGSSQAFSSSFAGVTFDTQSKYNSGGVFTHSTSSNTDQIVLNETGDYEVSADVTFDGTSGANDPCEARLTLNGSLVSGSTSYTVVGTTFADKNTVRIHHIVSAVAADVLRVEGRVTSGGAQGLAGGCRIVVRKVS